MAINKKLIHFNSKENFDNKVANNEILDTSIVFVKDSKEIYTHGNLYKSVNWNKLVPPPIKVGDVAYWTGSKIKTTPIDKWKDSLGTLVGVVVIPEGFLYDGRARIASLTTVLAHFSDTSQVSPMLINWNNHVFPTTLNDGSTTTGTATSGTFATESYKDTNPSFIDPNSGYLESNNMVPSPYNGDSINSSYTGNALLLTGNKLTHITERSNGEYYTYEHMITSQYSITSTVRAFTDEAGSNLKWYVPTIGELGFLCARNETIASTGMTFGNWNYQVPVLNMSVVDKNHPILIYINDGSTITTSLNDTCQVIPFAKI